MNRLLQDEGRRARARIAGECGFTLIELLVAMLVSLIVIGGGVYGIAHAFEQNTQITDRVISDTSAETGVEKLVIDLRYAMNSSSCPLTVSVPSAGVYQLSMCEQSGTLAAVVTGSTTYPSFSTSPTTVTWVCNTTASVASSVQPETCNRTFGSNSTIGFHGITSLTLTGLVGKSPGSDTSITSNGTNNTACSSSTGTLTCTYSLSSGLANSISWVGISALLADLKNPLNQADTTTVQTSSLIPLQTSAQLRNFGT